MLSLKYRKNLQNNLNPLDQLSSKEHKVLELMWIKETILSLSLTDQLCNFTQLTTFNFISNNQSNPSNPVQGHQTKAD